MDLFNALDVFENISDTPNNIATLNAIGMTYNASGQYKNAIDFYTQSVSEAKKSRSKKTKRMQQYLIISVSHTRI